MDGCVRLGRSVRTITWREESGFVRNAHFIPLKDSWLVHSATWVEGAVESLGTQAPIGAYFAPNHYHHIYLRKFAERFPAPILTSARASKRLGGYGYRLETLEARGSRLEQLEFIEPPGLRNGEAWVIEQWSGGRRLVVCDAFFNLRAPLEGLKGSLIRALRAGPGLTVPRSFAWMLEDRRRYADFLRGFLREFSPNEVFFSHGPALVGGDSPDRLLEALARAKLV